MITTGKLFLCATPIGNLEDITLRVLRVLQEVDLIAAEDTRLTRKLLSYYQIHTPLISYHQHNEARQAGNLVAKLIDGQQVALVSDSGMPGISDPGHEIIKVAIANEIPIIPLPGASASITALVISGLSTRQFVFEGFLPRNQADRRKRLQYLGSEERTLILYEAPHRLLSTLKEMEKCWGARQAAVVRELTKLFEEVIRGDLQYLAKQFQQTPPRGEITIIVAGASLAIADSTSEDPIQFIKYLEEQGYKRTEAIKEAARLYELPRNQLYATILKHNSREER